MTSSAAYTMVRLDQLRQADARLRRQQLAVRTWALAKGIPVDRDALTVVLAAITAASDIDGTDPHHWSVERVVEFVWAHCPLWCREAGVAVPSSTPQALTTWWRYLAETDQLSAESDELGLLRATLDTHTGPSRRTRARSSSRRRLR